MAHMEFNNCAPFFTAEVACILNACDFCESAPPCLLPPETVLYLVSFRAWWRYIVSPTSSWLYI